MEEKLLSLEAEAGEGHAETAIVKAEEGVVSPSPSPFPPPAEVLCWDPRRFLELCLRCQRPLHKQLLLSRCGHVYHEQCCLDWQGCVACDDAQYDSLPMYLPPALDGDEASSSPPPPATSASPDPAASSDEPDYIHIDDSDTEEQQQAEAKEMEAADDREELRDAEEEQEEAEEAEVDPFHAAADPLRSYLGNRRRRQQRRPTPSPPPPPPPVDTAPSPPVPAVPAAAAPTSLRRAVSSRRGIDFSNPAAAVAARTAALAAARSAEVATVLRRLRPPTTSSRGRSNIANPKDRLIKLFFEPQGVLEALFAEHQPTASQADAAGDGEPPPSQGPLDICDASPDVRLEYLSRKQHQLDTLRSEVNRLEKDLVEYTQLHRDRAHEKEKMHTKLDEMLASNKRLRNKNKTQHAELYKQERALVDTDEAVRRLLEQLAELDAADLQREREWKEKERREEEEKKAVHAAAQAAEGASSSNLFSLSSSSISSSSSLPATAPLTPSHHYLRLDHNDFFKDLLHLQPDLVYRVHAALQRADQHQSKEGQEAGDLSIPPELKRDLDLISMGLGLMPSVYTKETLEEMRRVAQLNPHLGLGNAQTWGKEGAAASSSTVSNSSKSTRSTRSSSAPPLDPSLTPSSSSSDPDQVSSLLHARRSISYLHTTLHRVVYDCAHELSSHNRMLHTKEKEAMVKRRALQQMQEKVKKVEEKLARLKAVAERYEQMEEKLKQRELMQQQQEEQGSTKKMRVSDEDGVSAAAPTTSSSLSSPPLSSSRACAVDLTSPSSDAAHPSSSSSSVSSSSPDRHPVRPTSGEPSHRLPSAYPSLYPQHSSSGGSSALRPSASHAGPQAAASGTGIMSASLSVSGVGGVAPRRTKSKFAAAFQLLQNLPADSDAFHNLNLGNVEQVAAAAHQAPPPLRPADLSTLKELSRPNPFGLKSTGPPPSALSSSLVSAASPLPTLAATHRKKGRSVGGAYLVRGHDGRGGHVSIYRSTPMEGAKPQQQQQQQQNKASSRDSAPPTKKQRVENTPTENSQEPHAPARASSPSPSSSSSSLFSLDQLAYRPSVKIESRNTKLSGGSSSQRSHSTAGATSAAATDPARSSSSANQLQKNNSIQALGKASSRSNHSALQRTRSQPTSAPSSSALASAFARAPPPAPSSARSTSSSSDVRSSPSSSLSTREVVDLIDDNDEPEGQQPSGGAAPGARPTHPFFARAQATGSAAAGGVGKLQWQQPPASRSSKGKLQPSAPRPPLSSLTNTSRR